MGSATITQALLAALCRSNQGAKNLLGINAEGASLLDPLDDFPGCLSAHWWCDGRLVARKRSKWADSVFCWSVGNLCCNNHRITHWKNGSRRAAAVRMDPSRGSKCSDLPASDQRHHGVFSLSKVKSREEHKTKQKVGVEKMLLLSFYRSSKSWNRES